MNSSRTPLWPSPKTFSLVSLALIAATAAVWWLGWRSPEARRPPALKVDVSTTLPAAAPTSKPAAQQETDKDTHTP